MKALEMGIGIVFAVIGIVIAVTAWTNQAPTVATSTSTAAGTALANAGVTSTSLSGTVYSFVNVFWALGALVIVGIIAFKYLHDHKG